MAGFRLELPTIQNWSCHSCSGCCKQHAIEVSEEERERILSQNWTEQDGIAANTPVLVPYAGPFWKKRYRLGHQSDGACVFLDENGLCRIHAKFGEAAKPLPCRIYPFTFHPSGGRLTVSLRYSCPSVVSNLGKAVTQRQGELRKLARAILPEDADEADPPRVTNRDSVSWPDFHRFIDAIDSSLSNSQIPFVQRLLSTLRWLELVEESRFEKVKAARLSEFLDLIVPVATSDTAAEMLMMESPTKIGLTQLRMLAGHYARQDTFLDISKGLRGRWRLLKNGIRFARGKGNIPTVQSCFREVPFADIEQDFGSLPRGTDKLFERYYRVKVRGLHFCGLAYYRIPMVEGFQHLALLFPAVLWLARWLALGDGRNSLQLADIETALSIADHHHGFSPAFGTRPFRKRVRLLTQTGDLMKLCGRYAN